MAAGSPLAFRSPRRGPPTFEGVRAPAPISTPIRATADTVTIRPGAWALPGQGLAWGCDLSGPGTCASNADYTT